MSKTLTAIIERASTDAEFRAQLQRDPEGTLASYPLTAEEKAALLSGDASPLPELGLDNRVTKWDSGSTSFGDNGPWS